MKNTDTLLKLEVVRERRKPGRRPVIRVVLWEATEISESGGTYREILNEPLSHDSVIHQMLDGTEKGDQ